MSSKCGSKNRVSKPSGTNAKTKSSGSKTSRRSSAYDKNFQHLLTEQCAYPFIIFDGFKEIREHRLDSLLLFEAFM